MFYGVLYTILIIKFLTLVSGYSNNVNSSLVFVFDTTGSMHDDLRQLREGAELILDTALNSKNHVISNFIFVPFNDPGIGPATITSDKEVFKQALNITRVRGGGDCMEKSLGGIQLALDISLPRSYVFVFTDATAGDHRLVHKVLDVVQKKQSQVVFVLTGHCNDLDKPSYLVYHQIASASSGQVFNLNKTSVHKVLDFVKSSVTGRSVNLHSVVNKAGYNYSHQIPVDSTLGEVTVSVSGSNPQITVVNPFGEEINGPPKLITTLDLAEIVVVKVIEPEPGNWTVRVGSDDNYSVKIVGQSNLTFEQGFSVQKPNNWFDTGYRPLQGAENYMMIKLTDAGLPVYITYSEILTLNGKVLFELPLKEVDRENRLYLADVFIPPEDFFYVAINGYDENNQVLRRIGTTAVQAKYPDFPVLHVSDQINCSLSDSVVLRCEVQSLVPVTAQWYKGNKRLQNAVSSLHNTTVEYTITDMDEGKAGLYRCIGRNVAGVSQAVTNVSLSVDPPHVTITSGNTASIVGENINISCSVFSDTYLMGFQLIVHNNIQNKVINLNIFENSNGYYIIHRTLIVNENDSGLYTCRAVNKGGETRSTVSISILKEPTVKIEVEKTKYTLGENMQIKCNSGNSNTVKILSPDGTIVYSKTNTDFKEYRHYFNIKHVLLKHSGLWRCVAERNNYFASESINITAILSPITSIEGSKYLTLPYGSNYTLKCIVKAVPTPVIMWYNGTEVIDNTTITQKSNIEHYSLLVLVNISENTENTYYCSATNLEGTSIDEVVIVVKKPLTILEGPKDQTIEINTQAKLYCKTDSYPKSTVKWYHNGTVLEPSDTVYLVEDNSAVFLKDMHFNNVGLYSCEVQNKYERRILNATLQIFGFEAPELLQDPAILYSQRESFVNITCRILKGKPKPKLTWVFNKTVLPSNAIIKDNGTRLTIPSVDFNHEGTYTCAATNIIGNGEYSVRLVLQYAPQLNDSNILDTVMEFEMGNKVVLNCAVYSVPQPLIVWTKDFKPITYSENLYLTDDYNLTFQSVSPQDSGTFICTASNNFGSNQRNFTLYIYAVPNITVPLKDPNIEIVEGQLIELPCAVNAHPKPEVLWTQNDIAIVETKRKLLDPDFTLRFIANLTDFGEYKCIASNKYGNASYTYNVYIWVPPKIKSVHPTKDVTLGSNVTIQCNAVGFPLPDIVWEFNGRILTHNTSLVSYNNVGDIYLTNVTIEYDGVYSCIAENIAGFDLASTYLFIKEPPQIISWDFSGPYIASNKDLSLSIPCQVRGKPRPRVMWALNDAQLDKDTRFNIDLEGTLTILFPSEEMSGNYTCIATNSAGETTSTVPVEIYTLPETIQSDQASSSTAVVEHTSVVVNCPIRVSQTDTLKWYKEGKLLNSTHLRFSNISRYNESFYECVVSNAIGFAAATVHLVVDWGPKFIHEEVDTNIEVIEGNDSFLDCEVDCKPDCEIKWLVKSNTIQKENKIRLPLLNIKRHHSGTYVCVVQNKHATISRRFIVNVLVPPFISEFDLLDVQLKQGTNATLSCEPTGWPKPTVTWKYNNTEWLQQNNSIMTINATLSSEGLFRCDATNKAGNKHLVYRVTVTIPARITSVILSTNDSSLSVENDVEIPKGSQARLLCLGDGNPPPFMQWFFNGNLLNATRFETTAEILLSVHSGVLLCSATNEVGRDEKRIKVDALEPPKIYKSLFDTSNSTNETSKIELLLGQPLFLHCHPYGNPVPQIYWFKNDLPLRLFDGKMYFLEFGEILTIDEISEEHEGNYTCVARNKIGEESFSYLITVLVPPPITKNSLSKITNRVGKTVALPCPLDGTPTPDVVWVKHPYTYITNEYSERIKILDNYTLSISNIEINDIGNYSCILTNKVGTTEILFDVNVELPPKIMSNNDSDNIENEVVLMYRSAVLKCPVKGYPQPKISWLKDTLKLNTNLQNIQRALDGALLLLWNVNVKMAGQYICIGENNAGTDHRRFNVFVKGKWGPWSPWGYCNVTCGVGYQHRDRTCRYIEDDVVVDKSANKTGYLILDHTTCKGLEFDKRKCTMPPCEEQIVPHWSTWSAWSACSASCGTGSRSRSRKCKPKGASCNGDNIQIKKCANLPPCRKMNAKNNEPSPFEPEETLIEDIHQSSEEIVEDNTDTYAQVELLKKVYPVMATKDLQNINEPCEAGYAYDDTSGICQDINECDIESNNCHSTQICGNIPGGYTCACEPGFASLAAGQRCLDINECEIHKGVCEFACVNTVGGFVCACPSHMRLHYDRRRCVPVPAYKKFAEEMDSDGIFSTNVKFPRRYPIK